MQCIHIQQLAQCRYDKLTRYTPRERDAAPAAQIAGWVGNVLELRFVDFAFPVSNPEKPGEMVWVVV